jgi:hypothetical protein
VGDVAAVQASVDAGRAAAERIGKVISAHVIPRPDSDVREMLKIDGWRDSGPQQGGGLTPDREGGGRKSEHAGARQMLEPKGGRKPGRTGAGQAPEAETGGRTPERKGEAGRVELQGAGLESLTVPELRALAREMPDFPIRGRAVARARREELIEYLRRMRPTQSPLT